eukprot:991996_1
MNHQSKTANEATATSTSKKTTKGVMKEGSVPNRYVFEFNGQKIYEWDQNLEEVNMYVDTPPGKRAGDFDIQIENNKLRVGLKGHGRFFIEEQTFGKVNTSESSWYLDDSILHIVLMKVSRGSVWEAPLVGRAIETIESNSEKTGIIDPIIKEKMKQDLMLERFAEENPGFDFRDAKFNGEVPDPRTFMGGINHH